MVLYLSANDLIFIGIGQTPPKSHMSPGLDSRFSVRISK